MRNYKEYQKKNPKGIKNIVLDLNDTSQSKNLRLGESRKVWNFSDVGFNIELTPE